MKQSALISCCLLALVAGMPAFTTAQQAAKPLIPALRGVTLTTGETAKIAPIIQAYKQAHPAGSTLDPQAHKAMIAQVLADLTSAQQAQVTANLAAMRKAKERPEPKAT